MEPDLNIERDLLQTQNWFPLQDVAQNKYMVVLIILKALGQYLRFDFVQNQAMLQW